MSANSAARKVVPAQLGFLAIYNPSLGTTDDTVDNQIVYYTNAGLLPRDRNKSRNGLDQKTEDARLHEEKNEQLRQIGLAQGMVEFGRSFSDGRAVDTVETEKARIVLHELEAGWWILAVSICSPYEVILLTRRLQSINLTVLPGTTKISATKGKPAEEKDTTEYSSREVKPAILLLGDLLRAYSTFLLHHASSMSALFVRTKRPKFMSILGRFWDSFAISWNVLMHGNPASSLYGGIKLAACGELGVGVGEEDRGSGEREVLEGFVGRIEGLVDVIVSKFGDGESDVGDKEENNRPAQPSQPWLGSGNEPAAEDGAVFLGTGALSRKSLRDVSHWVEDLYQWGENAYGVIDNPSSTRRSRKPRFDHSIRGKKSLGDKRNSTEERGLIASPTKSVESQTSPIEETMTTLPPPSIVSRHTAGSKGYHFRGPSLKRAPGSSTSTDGEPQSTKLMQYLKLGYGTHWSLAGTSAKSELDQKVTDPPNKPSSENNQETSAPETAAVGLDGSSRDRKSSHDDSQSHYMIGLLGDLDEEDSKIYPEDILKENGQQQNARLLLRTLTVELEREEDARAEADISIDLSTNEKDSHSILTSSEHTGTSHASFDSQDRNKTKKLRVVVYACRPFIMVFLFELRTDTLALTSHYRSLHHQLQPLLKPLVSSTSFRALRPELSQGDDKSTPIYDLIWDPKLLTISSTIPNIPDPYAQPVSMESLTWTRIEALNTHMQVVNTYIAISTDKSEQERTCKTNRGWWVVWTRVPDSSPQPTPTLFSGSVKVPDLIAEDSVDSTTSEPRGRLRSHSSLDPRSHTYSQSQSQSQSASRTPAPSKSRATSSYKSSMMSGPAHPYLEAGWKAAEEQAPRDKEIWLIRRASDHSASQSRFASGASAIAQEAGWGYGPAKLAQGIGVDTKRYIDALLNLNR